MYPIGALLNLKSVTFNDVFTAGVPKKSDIVTVPVAIPSNSTSSNATISIISRMRIPERFNFNESDFCLEMLPFRLKCFCACDKLKSEILKFPFEYEIKAGEMFQIVSSITTVDCAILKLIILASLLGNVMVCIMLPEYSFLFLFFHIILLSMPFSPLCASISTFVFPSFNILAKCIFERMVLSFPLQYMLKSESSCSFQFNLERLPSIRSFLFLESI